MIKDSKLIGTKIAAPFDWKKFKVGELFDVCTTTGFDAGKLVFTDSGVPFIGRTNSNYGIQGYLHNMPDSKPNPLNVISISQIGSQSAQYRKTVWYASQNMFYVELLNHDLTLDSGLFFVSIFNKILQKYLGYTSYPTKNSIFNWIIELPITADNQPDFTWMSNYIKVVKADYLEQKELSNQNEIKAYLSAGNVDSLNVTDADRQFLRDFEKLPRRKFKVGELFDCKPLNCPEIAGYTGYVKDDMVISPYGHTPYLAATSNNNGISGYSDLKANNKSNAITLSTTADSANTVFYQEQEFIGRQQMEGLRLKSKVLTNDLAFYFIPFIKKQACLFNYGNKLTVNKLKDFIVIVPVIDSSQIDMKSIEKYMQIQIKLTIGKHAKYLDEELALMKIV